MPDFLLKQDGDYLLKQDGDKIILNVASAEPFAGRVDRALVFRPGANQEAVHAPGAWEGETFTQT